jgi:immune inhibitor A
MVVALAAIALAAGLATPALAANPRGKADDNNKSDNLPGALAKKQDKLKTQARDMVLKGQAAAKGANKVVQVAKGQYVELAFEGEDQILTFLSEFGTQQATHNHGTFGTINHGGTPGPLHNTIPEPDRNLDNTTIWTDDFSQGYYENLLFNKAQVPSMANWYLAASDGRYSVDGYVSPWTRVPFNEAAYGSNYCGSIVCTRDIGRFLVDQAQQWCASETAAGKSQADIDAFLATFDVWDRYDFDHDGNFNEPDGYIDHFQSVHAGVGEETGGGAQGTDAIWSHRSYANAGFPAGTGPTVGGVLNGSAGLPIPCSSKWIGDYTIEPENGGVGVFAHEFGHDLGLPDEYDTSGNTGGAENSTAWWTNWSQGSYGTIGQDLGSYPVHMDAWEKWFLGWLNYDVAFTGQTSSHKLSAISANTKQAQGVFVVLPNKQVSKNVGTPFEGSYFYHSGSGNDLDNTMTREVTLPSGTVSASFQGRWHIEPCWDYAYLQVSTDGTNFTNIHTSASAGPAFNVNAQDFGEGITGISGTPLACNDNLSPTPTWTTVTADLSAYAGQHVWIRFRYWTDGATVGDGLSVDNLQITGQPLDGAETDPGWTYDGFVRTTGTIVSSFPNYYLAEYRNYTSYDIALKLGPYNFIDPAGTTQYADWVEHFPYQDGLLIWYFDLSQADNNVGDHPGEGLILPIDAHPGILHWSDGSVARPRIQSYDSTFGLEPTDPISLHNIDNGTTLTRSSLPAARVFNDNNSYWVSGDPGDAPNNGRYQAEWSSVNNPHTNTSIKVAGVSAQGGFMQIIVNP